MVSSASKGQVEDLLRAIAATDVGTLRKILRSTTAETVHAFDAWALEHYTRQYDLFTAESACGLSSSTAYLAMTERKPILNLKLSLRLVAMLLVEEARRSNIKESA